MIQFFAQALARNIPISGPLLQEKARHFAGALGIEEFQAFDGWLTVLTRN